MVFWGCSDVVESWAEHPILDAESRRNAAFTSDSEQPRRASPWGTRGLLTTTRCDEPASSIDEFGDLSIDRVRREKVKPGELEQLPESKTKINHPAAMLYHSLLQSSSNPPSQDCPRMLKESHACGTVPPESRRRAMATVSHHRPKEKRAESRSTKSLSR